MIATSFNCTIDSYLRDKILTSGKDPTGLAVSVIYIAGIIEGEIRMQRKIDDQCELLKE